MRIRNRYPSVQGITHTEIFFPDKYERNSENRCIHTTRNTERSLITSVVTQWCRQSYTLYSCGIDMNDKRQKLKLPSDKIKSYNIKKYPETMRLTDFYNLDDWVLKYATRESSCRNGTWV